MVIILNMREGKGEKERQREEGKRMIDNYYPYVTCKVNAT